MTPHRYPERQSTACAILLLTIGHTFGVRVDGPTARRFLSLTAFQAEGCGIALMGDEHKVSVTGFTFSAIWHDKHSAELSAFGRYTPLSGCAGLLHGKACHTILRSLRFLTNRVPLPPLFRGQNKTPRNILFISISTVSTGCCVPSKRGWQRNWIHRGALRPANPVTCFPPGKVVAPATKGGMHFLARRAVVRFYHKRAPSINLEVPPQPSRRRRVKPKNPRGDSPVKL